MNIMMAFAALLQWATIDVKHPVTLEHDLLLEQAAGTPGLLLKKGMKATVVDQYPLDAIRVQFYQVKLNPCPTAIKNQTSEMTIINEVYGVQLAAGCEIGMYVEFKDLYTDSPFSDRSSTRR